MKIKNIAFGVATFTLAFGISIQSGYYLQTKYEGNLETSFTLPDGGGLNIFRSRVMDYRKPGDPRGDVKAFAPTNDQVGHPMFQYILDAHNGGRQGQSSFDEEGNWLGYKQGHLSTEKMIEMSKSRGVYQGGHFLGSRYNIDQRGQAPMTFFASSPESLKDRKSFIEEVVLNKYDSQKTGFASRKDVKQGSLTFIRSLTPAEVNLRYREYLENKREEYLKNTPEVTQTGVIDYDK